MSDLTRLNVRYKIFTNGDVIDLKDLQICPERIVISATEDGGGLRVDVTNYDGNNLAWFALLTPEFRVELT